MSCNCHISTGSACTRCSNGLSCGCPPDYSVAPILPDCQCCPEGYTKVLNSANVYVCEGGGGIISTIPCQPCVTSVPTDCVFYKPQGGAREVPLCVDIADGDNLTTILAKMCITRESNILAMLQVIGTSTVLKAALCEIVSVCPSVGNQVPIPGPIVVTFP